MKKITLAVLVLSFLMSACGGASNQGEQQETKQKEKKEKKLSKSTREGMEQLLTSCHIEIPAPLEFTKVSKSSSNYKISYTATEVDDTKREEFDAWFTKQTEHLVEHGWKKRVVRDNEEMLGSTFNEIIFFKPAGSSFDVTYGITLSTAYTPEDKTYKVYASAD